MLQGFIEDWYIRLRMWLVGDRRRTDKCEMTLISRLDEWEKALSL
jgi:hypothetical protein